MLDWEDFVFSNLWLPLGAFASCVFCTREIGWGWRRFRVEASKGDGARFPWWFRPVMRYFIPICILLIILMGLYDKVK